MTRATASQRTVALTAGLALCSAGLAAGAPAGPLLSHWFPDGFLGMVAALAVCFLLADLCLLHVEVRREAYSVTLAGIPLAAGVLLCDSRELVAARVLGAAAAFAWQRATPLKACYNLAAYAFEAALDLAVMHLLVRPDTELTVELAVVCGLVLVTVDQLMSLLVTLVIRWHQGRLTLQQRAEVHLPALLCSVLATAGAYGLLLLSTHGAVGTVVIGVFLAAAALAYRAFQVLHRRHQALAHLHAFITLNDGGADVTELAGRMLEQIRSLMRASTAELLLTDPTSPLQVIVEEDGRPRLGDPRGRAEEHPTTLPSDALPRATSDPAARGRLRARGVKDAVIVPLPGPGGTSVGTLTVMDRLGDTGSFSQEDQTLLQTLAGHLAVAVNSGRRRDRLRYDATHDVLTGLGNRVLLNDAITGSLAAPHRTGDIVMLLDLDKFKEVNDTLGHHVGDALLTVIAQRLITALPTTATVVRLGGDEFAALIPHAEVTGALGRDAFQPAEALARQVADALAQPVQLPEATLSVHASIGVALAQPGSTASDLLRHADTAMYEAKDTDARVVVYTPDLDRGRAERLALLADLHLALERGELHVVYQPKLELATGRITSVEALVRWRHPRLGPLSPDVFIPLAEANGLIEPLTEVVLTAALRQCALWRQQGVDVAVAVNLSARTVNSPDLPERISSALFRAGVPASHLILEVTESAVMDDAERAVTILERIAAIGVSLSLDDFGTGYSSLSYLQQLPVREVKIDRSFITGLTAGNSRSQVLVRSIINLGTSLDLRVVAEGVEDAATLELLRELGCHLIQGYHVSRPLPAHQIAALQDLQPRLRAVAG
jgi:diguanylate cyclase (GGDEF)-like protein